MKKYIIAALCTLALAGGDVAVASYPHFPYRGLEEEKPAPAKPDKTAKLPKPTKTPVAPKPPVADSAAVDSTKPEAQAPLTGNKAKIEKIINEIVTLGRMSADTDAQRAAKSKKRDAVVEELQGLKFSLGPKGDLIYSVIVRLQNDNHILIHPDDRELFGGKVERGSRYYCAAVIKTLRKIQKSL